jgi:cellulose synthase (UDP-forming)
MESDGGSPRRAGRTDLLYSRPARALTILYVLVGLSYLWWRVTETINPNALALSLAFLGADILGFGFFLLFAANLWTRTRRYPAEPEPGLSVDVYIPTYNEPPEILRPTILATLEMDYPHRTYVLDDGQRDAVRRLCAELGVHYLTRPDNRGAKAGNINAALPRTSGELIAIFDADHVPYRNFLTELLGYFRDPEVGLVQAPQSYYNLDSFQHGPNTKSDDDVQWHEQSVFYDRILPGKDRWNAAFWCGSSAILRRSALENVGGVDTRTVTEDMHTAMGIHAAGWKSVYHDRELALGIAPDDAEAFLGQRLRWAQGAMQILRFDNPLRRRGLSVRQRIAYFASVAYVFEYVPKSIYLAIPVIALTFDVLPMQNMGWNLIFRFAPYYLLGLVAGRLLTGRSNPYMQAERFHLLKLWIMLRAIPALVMPGRLSFRVTAKAGEGRDTRLAQMSLVRWQIAAGIACVAAIVWGATLYFTGRTTELTGIAFVITLGWALFNAGMVASLVRWIMRRPHRRAAYRFTADIPVVVWDQNGGQELCRTADVSALGIAWMTRTYYPPGSRLHVRLRPPGVPPVAATVEVVECRPSADRETLRCAGAFEELDAISRRALIMFLFQQVAPMSVRDGGQEEREGGGIVRLPPAVVPLEKAG